MTAAPDASRPLAGVRIVEISSFVAVPLAGMTLAQLGAEVIRVDPIGGAADYHRWPVTDDGESIYWAGLNKGKRSVAADFRSPGGQDLVQRLIADSGVQITNVGGRQWHSYETLTRLRPDLIHVEVSGRADGGTGASPLPSIRHSAKASFNACGSRQARPVVRPGRLLLQRLESVRCP